MIEGEQQDNFRAQEQLLSNQGYNGAGIIQIRLDTDLLLEKIELYLSGLKKQSLFNSTTQTVEEKLIAVGKPKANKEGVQGIITFIQSVVNPQTVQGNIDETRCYGIIADARMDLTKMIIISRVEWDIEPRETDAIIQFCMNTIKIFLTRTIDNLERQSYGTFQTREVQTRQDGNKGFIAGLFGK
jgi:hypothetical protein